MTIDPTSDSAPTVVVHSVSPLPSPAEAVAISAALEQVWPKPQKPQKLATGWRFSGRPWSRSGNRFRP